MADLLSVAAYMLSHERDLCVLCDDLERVTAQEEPILNELVGIIKCKTGVDASGSKTYPLELLLLHFRS